jgi:hypothetical protein
MSTLSHLGFAKIGCQIYYPSLCSKRLPWFKQFFGNHGVTHLIREYLVSGSPASAEEAKLPTSLEFAARALDGVEYG